jgi:hypothetical protein
MLVWLWHNVVKGVIFHSFVAGCHLPKLPDNEKIISVIDKQLASNSGKNLFYEDSAHQLQFVNETLDKLDALQQLDALQENTLLDDLMEKSLAKFCEVKQYYSFDKIAVSRLKEVYVHLIADLRDIG